IAFVVVSRIDFRVPAYILTFGTRSYIFSRKMFFLRLHTYVLLLCAQCPLLFARALVLPAARRRARGSTRWPSLTPQYLRCLPDCGARCHEPGDNFRQRTGEPPICQRPDGRDRRSCDGSRPSFMGVHVSSRRLVSVAC